MVAAVKTVCHRPMRESWRAALRPPPDLTVSQWCDRYRYLSPRYTAEHGRWHTSRTPYLQDILDAFADPGVTQITFLKAARVGATEAVHCMLSFTVAVRPMPVLYMLPTEDAAHEEMTGRVKTALQDNPELQPFIPPGKWAGEDLLQLRTLDIYPCWASSHQTLTRRTIGVVIVDELDNCAAQAGFLGDTVDVARQRLITFGRRAKLVIVSSPTLADAPTQREFLAGDKRRYHVPCSLCGAYQTFQFGRFRVPDGATDPDEVEREQLAWYECESCQGRITEEHRWWMVERGVWVPEAQKIVETLPLDDPEIVAKAVVSRHQWKPKLEGEAPLTRRTSWHIWRAYTPWADGGFSTIYADWLRVRHDVSRLRVFVNATLGESWEDVTTTASTRGLGKRIDPKQPRRLMPKEALVLVAGIDVHAGSIYWEVWGWGILCESWLIDHGVLYATHGDGVDLISQWYGWLQAEPFKREDGTVVRLSLTAVDSGYRAPDVYALCQRNPGLVPVKGLSTVDVTAHWFARESKSKTKRRFGLLNVNTASCKRALYQWAQTPGSGPGTMHLHAETDAEFIRQFASEHLVPESTKGGKERKVWKPKGLGRDNHYLDAGVYALVAAEWARALYLQAPKKQGDGYAPAGAPEGRGRRGWQIGR